MRWAVAFLPSHMRQLMNLLASLESWRGSGFRVVALAVRLPMILILWLSWRAGAGSVDRRLRHALQVAAEGDGADRAAGVEGKLVHQAAVGAGDVDGGHRPGAGGQP